MVSPDETSGGGGHAHPGGRSGVGPPHGPHDGPAHRPLDGPLDGPPYGPAHGPLDAPVPRGGLRVGDRERDEVTRLLHDAFAQGRITRAELDERLDTTLSARTARDLRRVTADLPGGWTEDDPTGEDHPGGPWTGSPWTGLPRIKAHRVGWAGSPWAGRPGGHWLAGQHWSAGEHWPGGEHWSAGEHWPGGLHRHRHGPAALGPHLAARRAAMRRGRSGPPPVAIAAVVILAVALVSGAAWPLFTIVKLLFLAWLAAAVLGLARHRHHLRRQGPGHR